MLTVTAAVLALVLQPTTPADLAARMSGHWVLNASLSDQGRGRGPGRSGGAAFAVAPVAFQRGGRGGGASEPPREVPPATTFEAAAQQALAAIQQAPPEMTIAATATEMTLQEPRGDSVFAIDGKSKTVDVPGGTLKVKSRWDRATLRQEFSSSMRILHRSWSIDGDGRLVLKQRTEGIGVSMRESQAVYDRR